MESQSSHSLKSKSVPKSAHLQSLEARSVPSSTSMTSPDKVKSRPEGDSSTQTSLTSIDLAHWDTNDQFKIHNLAKTSEELVRVAHSCLYKVHSSEQNVLEYYKLIKLAIGCLLVLLQKYQQHLNAHTQAQIYLRLARLYFHETMNHNLAEEASMKAISIASRNKLTSVKFQAQFLALEVLFVNSKTLAWKYLNTTIDEYSQSPNLDPKYCCLLKLLKYKYRSIMEPQHSYGILEELLALDVQDPDFQQLVLIYRCSLLLYQGKLEPFNKVLQELEDSLRLRRRPQLTCMVYLFKIWRSLVQNRLDECKLHISRLNSFVKEQKNASWALWKPDGAIEFQIAMNKDRSQDQLRFQVQWLTGPQCVFMLYFVTGLSYLVKSYDGKNKAAKFFDACLTLLDQEQDLLMQAHAGVPNLQHHEDLCIKNKYLATLVCYYQVLCRFNSGDWSLQPDGKDLVLFDLIDSYDEGLLSSQELLLYHKIFPNILYLFGAYYHSRQDFSAARSYYTRTRSHLNKPSVELPPESRFMNDPFLLSLYQVGVGIGGDVLEHRLVDSDLYVLSSLNLLTILSWEVKQTGNEHEFVVKTGLKKDILTDLAKFSSNETYGSKSVLSSDVILTTTIQLFKVIYDSSHLSATLEMMNSRENVDLVSAVMTSSDLISNIAGNFPLLACILFYLSSFCIVDSQVRLKNLQTSHHYAKMCRNLKLLCLTSCNIYQLMSDNESGQFSLEEILDQKSRFEGYVEKFNKRYNQEFVKSERPVEPSSEGQYDNEKNDDYYDKTAGDISMA